jgi:transposase-like protein
MHNKAFSKLLEQLKNLTPAQKDKLQSTLQKTSESEEVSVVIDTVESCPYCDSRSYKKWGVRSALQRYRCNQCHKTFNALTGTPLARLRHKEVWLEFLEDLSQSTSIRESAKHCGVDKSTTFRWRHRMLNNPKRLSSKHLHGIIEFDETYFLESHKGERHLNRKPRKRGGSASRRGISSEQTAVLVARDRNGNTMDAILFKSNQDTLAEVMIPVIDTDALLCSDKKTSYRAFAKKYHLILETINSSAKEYVRDKIYHIQNVNAYDSRLKLWMQHFHGVATKYLESYLGWMRLLDREKELTPERLLGIVAERGMVCQPLVRT